MPTVVHFNRAEESIRLEEDFDKVNPQLHGSDGGCSAAKSVIAAIA
jgi:hypothetical protein